LFAACPVHGGSDSLHVTGKNGKAMVNCFGCSAPYKEIVAAVEASPQGAQDPAEDEEPEEASGPTITIGKPKVRGKVAAAVPAVDDPIGWLADYCGVDRAWLEAEIPVEATTDGWIAHVWPGVEVLKLRKPNTAERRWHPKGANGPRLWPLVPDDLPEEVWLVEGETDVIVLRSIGLEHVYTAG